MKELKQYIIRRLEHAKKREKEKIKQQKRNQILSENNYYWGLSLGYRNWMVASYEKTLDEINDKILNTQNSE